MKSADEYEILCLDYGLNDIRWKILFLKKSICKADSIKWATTLAVLMPTKVDYARRKA